jgi:fatty-acyl-CoA synthase
MDEDGYYFLVDRARDMYITGGENVYPAEVERILRQHPDVKDIAVAGIPDERWGEVGHAFVIGEKDSNLCAEDILSYCREHMAKFKCPRSVTFCEDFPRTSLGKVRKRELINNIKISGRAY